MIAKLIKPVIAGVLTASVFLLMRILIVPTGEGPGESEPPPIVDITRQDRDETSEKNQRHKPVPPKLKPLPPIQKNIQTNLAATDSKLTTGMSLPTVIPTPTGGGGLITERHATPLVRIPPQYPVNAQDREIEGWVMVEFTINLAGGVEDVVVVDAEPPRTFNSAVIRAIRRWKYQPKMTEGKPVAQYNMRELVRFQFDG